jgi:hypothetical protein
MSKTILVTCSDDRMGRKNGLYGQTQKKIETIFRNNPQFGIRDFLSLTIDDIFKTEFYQQNKLLLDNTDPAKNGRVFKPYSVQQGLLQIEDGDFLIYTDSSPELFPFDEDFRIQSFFSLEVIKTLCANNMGILTAFVKWDTRNIKPGLKGIHTHENFSTDRCMRVMGLERFAKSFMGASGMIVIQKRPATVDFVNEWLQFCTIDECSALGKKEVPNDYSYWDEEENIKSGHRSDQSVLGLLLCKYGYKMVNILYNDMNPYNFLNFCRECTDYTFEDPNEVPDEPRRIKKGDKVVNKAGTELTVFEIWPEGGEEMYVVGTIRESCYKTKLNQIRLV